MATDYKANRSPMPPDLAEQIPWVHEACEALGVPILTSERYEADDVIGTLAEKAGRAGFEVAIVTGDKDFFQLVHDGIKVYNPKDDGTWFDAAGVKEKFGVTPEQVVDVLALMGDSIDNIKGVPGIGEKGARDLIATYGSLEALLAHAAEVRNKRYREGLLDHAEDARQSRELARIRTDVPVRFDPERCAIAAPSRERCFELFSRLGFRSLVLEYAPTAETIGKDYAIVDTLDELRALATSSEARGRFGLRVLPDAPAAMRAGIVGLVVFDRAAAGALRADRRRQRPAAAACSAAMRRGDSDRRSGRPGGARRAEAGARGRVRRQGRARPEVRRDRARPARHHARGARNRHDDRQLPARRDAIVASARGPGDRAHRLQGAHRGGRLRPRRQGGVVRDDSRRGARSITPASAPIWRCSCRPTLRDDAEARRLQRLYDELERPLIPVLVDIERAGVASTARRSRAGRPRRAGARRGWRRDLRAGRRGVQHQLAEEALGDPVRQARAAHGDDPPDDEDQGAVDGVRGARGAGAHARAAAADPRVARLQKLKGTYIDALPQLVNPRPAASTPASTRRSPRPAG